MSAPDLEDATTLAEARSSRALQANLFRLASRQEARDGGEVVSRCAYCEAGCAGTVEETAAWFRVHRASCAQAPELIETATMKARARNSLLRRARAEKIQANRDRKESLRRQACELLELGSDTAAIAATWNGDAVRSLAPSGTPWSANSVASLVGSVRTRPPVQLDQA